VRIEDSFPDLAQRVTVFGSTRNRVATSDGVRSASASDECAVDTGYLPCVTAPTIRVRSLVRGGAYVLVLNLTHRAPRQVVGDADPVVATVIRTPKPSPRRWGAVDNEQPKPVVIRTHLRSPPERRRTNV